MFKKGFAVIAALFLISATLTANTESVENVIASETIEDEAFFYGCARDCVDTAIIASNLIHGYYVYSTYISVYHACYAVNCGGNQ